MNNSQNKYLRGLYGSLLGDACGVPFEFSHKSELEELGPQNINYPFDLDEQTYKRAHKGAPENAWSDDGAQMLALMDSCLETQKFDLDHFAEKLKNWYKSTHYSVDHCLFDIGNQTRVAMRNLMSGQSPDVSGPSQDCHNGNGSLMRCLGLVFAGLGEQGNEALVNASMDSSLPTHANAKALVTCAVLNVFAQSWSTLPLLPWIKPFKQPAPS